MKNEYDIYSIEFYLAKASNLKAKRSVSLKNSNYKNFKILVQDDVKNSLYFVDA